MSTTKDWAVVEQEIGCIPGNEPVLEELYEVLETGEALALVGAGASAGLWPLWDEFLGGFIAYGEKCGMVNKVEADYFTGSICSSTHQ